jgi:hypothetical protein
VLENADGMETQEINHSTGQESSPKISAIQVLDPT